MVFFNYPGKNSFGKFEQGNKVYYNELENYFQDDPAFQSKSMSFKKNILPEIKVKHPGLIPRGRW